MKKDIIKLILLFISILVIVILFFTKIDASQSNLGKTTEITLADSPWNYCVQHDKKYRKESVYTYQYYLYIRGEEGTCYYCGNTNNTKTYKANAILAYILAGEIENQWYGQGYGSEYSDTNTKTARQLALWTYWNEWLTDASEVSDGYGLIKFSGGSVENGKLPNLDNLTNGANAKILLQHAREYAEDSSSAYIKNNTNTTINTDNGKVGPFNISYSGCIYNIQITDKNGNAITIDDGISFEQDGVNINGTAIKPDMNFYILNNSGKILKNVKVDIKKTQKKYIAGINILTATNASQTLLNVGPSSEEETTYASTQISVENETLKIVKSTVDGTRQDNVGFLIYRADTDNGSTPFGYLYYKNQEFAKGRMIYDTRSKFWSGGDKGQQAAKEGATIFFTSTETVNGEQWPGFFEISGLPPGTYNIGEVYNENEGYESSTLKSYTVEVNGGEQKGPYYDIARVTDNVSKFNYNQKMPKTQTVSVVTSGGNSIRLGLTDSTDIKQDPIITISKKNGTQLTKEVKFNIKCISGPNKDDYVIYNKSTGKFSFNDSPTIPFTTEDNGKFQVVLPAENTYKIIEIYNPDSRYNPINISDVKLISPTSSKAIVKKSSSKEVTLSELENGNSYNIEITNSKNSSPGSGGGTTLDIAGTVWIEKSNPTGKGNYTNEVYTTNEDYVVSNAKVYLIRKNGSSIRSAKTGTNGKYSFSVSSIDLSQYYVKVVVDDSCRIYQNGSVVKDLNGNELKFNYTSYTKVTSQYDVNNGSKFMNYQTGNATTFTGQITDDSSSDTTENEKDLTEDKYGLSGLYNNGQILNINLGLKEISTSEKIEETIEKAEITINGYKYIYWYNRNGRSPTTGIQKITVNWQSKSNITAYTRDIYPSDIVAVKMNNATMEIKITYIIIITNETKSSDHSPISDVPQNDDGSDGSIKCYEDNLVVENGNLINTFDSSRYTLDDSNWTKISNSEARYNKEVKVEENDSSDPIEITFKLTNSAIYDILNHDYKVENMPTKASMTSYHKWHEYLTWTIIVENTDSEGNTTTSTKTKHRTVSHEDPSKYCEADAPYFAFTLGEEERTISGTVFEDTDDTNGDNQLLGNGRYENSENSVNDVKVELLKKEDNSIAILYKKNSSTSIATTTTLNGKYTFTGVIPGEYYVRFTYGDGHQVISDGTKVYSSQYKSTIIPEDSVVYSKLKQNDSDTEWYLYNRDIGYSLAVDNISDRSFETYGYDSIYEYSSNYKGLDNYKNNKRLTANTPNFDVKIEATVYNSGNWNNIYPSFDDMNFGIIKMPVVSLNIYKKISYVSITLSNGQVITQGDPSTATSNIPYISTLDVNDSYGFGRGGYVKAELDTQYLYGSTLQVTYEIKVLNTSDINYKTEGYYKYGEKGSVEQEYTVTVDEILDYLDPALTYLYCERADVDIKDLDENNNGLNQDNDTSSISRENANTKAERTFSKVLDVELKDCELNTVYGGKSENSNKSVVKVTASKVLSTDDDDLEFKNLAEIVKITTDKDGGGNLCRFMAPTAKEEDGRDDYRSITTDVATITVTPPTGIKDNTVIIISIGIGLIIVISGIVIIKKKVL